MNAFAAAHVLPKNTFFFFKLLWAEFCQSYLYLFLALNGPVHFNGILVQDGAMERSSKGPSYVKADTGEPATVFE